MSHWPHDPFAPPGGEPLPTSPMPSASSSFGSEPHGDMRERIRALEVTIHHTWTNTIERMAAAVRRMEGIDRRLEAGDARMGSHHERLTGLDTEVRRLSEVSGQISGLDKRLSAIEQRWAMGRAALHYVGAAILSVLVLTGKVTVEQVKEVARLFGFG